MKRKSIYLRPVGALAILTLILGALIAFNNARIGKTRYSWIALSTKDTKETLEKQVAEHPDAKFLNIFSASFQDADTAALAQVTSLDSVHIAKSDLGAETIGRIIRLPSLKRVYLTELKLSDPARAQQLINAIAESPALEELYLEKIALTGLDLSPFGKLSHLKSLSIQNAGLNSDQLPFLQKLATLTKLTLSENPIDCSFFANLGDAKLTILGLANTLVDDSCAEVIAGRGELNSLDLGFTKLSEVGVATLKELKNLDFLTLANLPARNETISSLASLSRLIDLDISGTQVTDGIVAILKNAKKLEQLSLSRTTLSKEELIQLGSLHSLYSLNLSETKTDDDVVTKLTNLNLLGTLSLSKTPITEGSLVSLSRFKYLEDLSLVGTSISQAALENFEKQNTGVSVMAEDQPKGELE